MTDRDPRLADIFARRLMKVLVLSVLTLVVVCGMLGLAAYQSSRSAAIQAEYQEINQHLNCKVLHVYGLSPGKYCTQYEEEFRSVPTWKEIQRTLP